MSIFSLSRVLLLAAFMLSAAGMEAQQATTLSIGSEQDVLVDYFTTNDGLSQGYISGLAIDSSGYVWVGTHYGLNRYDGYNFKTFIHSDKDSNSLAADYITWLYIDQQNRLWIGTDGGGLDCFNIATETFTHFRHHPANPGGIDASHVGQIKPFGKDGFILYTQTFGNQWVYTPKPGRHNKLIDSFDITPLAEVYPITVPYLAKEPGGVFAQPNGSIWIADDDSVFTIFSKNALQTGGKPVTHIETGQATCVDAFALVFDEGGKVAYMVAGNELLKWTEQSGKFSPFVKLPAGFRIQCDLSIDNKKRLWAGPVHDTILCIDLNTLEIAAINPKTAGGTRLSFWGAVRAVDRYGNIWFGTPGNGLYKMAPLATTFKKLPSLKERNNSPWLPRTATYGQHALYDATAAEKWQRVMGKMQKEKNHQEITSHPTDWAIDSKGHYWTSGWCTNRCGEHYLYKADPKNGMIKTVQTIEAANYYGQFLPVIPDRHNGVWYGEAGWNDSTRLYHVDSTGKTIATCLFPVKTGEPRGTFIYDWYHEENGKTWYATRNGLFSFIEATGKWQHYKNDIKDPASLPANTVMCIQPDPVEPGRYLWLGTSGGGLTRLDKTTGKCINYTTTNGLPENTVCGILPDRHNNLWLSSGNDICHFDRKTSTIRRFDKLDGVVSNEFNGRMFSMAASGELYFGGTGGHTYFNPEEYYISIPPAKVVINTLKLMNKPVSYSHNHAQSDSFYLAQPLEQMKEVVFNYDQRMISFGFALTDMTHPSKNRFRYQLEGLSEEWIDNGTSHEAIFTNLSPGTYTLKVLGQGASGIWAKAPAIMSIRILPPWWGTWWFRLLMTLPVGGVLYGLYRYRLRQALRIERMRNQIAQDLHDEIGSTLSSISLYGAVMQKTSGGLSEQSNNILNKIIESTSHMMESMNDMVWTIKADNDSFEHVVNRMRAFAVNMTEAKEVKLHFETDRQAEKLNLNMDQRKNIYLVYKEAVNNAIKYSACRNLYVNITDGDNKLELNIEDDGIGFDLDTAVSNTQLLGGNGLRGMKVRAKEIGAELIVRSIKGGGTGISLVLPLKNH